MSQVAKSDTANVGKVFVGHIGRGIWVSSAHAAAAGICSPTAAEQCEPAVTVAVVMMTAP